MNSLIIQTINESLSVKAAMASDDALQKAIEVAANCCIQTFKSGGKILFCGNGGSAADAQHLAAELSGRFYTNRAPLFAEALHVNTSFMTAVANDYGYDAVFARMVTAAGRPGDVLFAISTSGNSPSILNAATAARAQSMQIIGMTGAGGGALKSMCDVVLAAPSHDTPRIQEAHILMGHIVCLLVEKALFP